jgi:F420-non-reducing hydrogenase iron-sulfur subunit
MSDFEPKIVAFCCNWSAYPGVDAMAKTDNHLPENIKFIKVMCGGAVTPSFILKAFELGADGVIVATCHVEDCHYITGARQTVDIYDRTEKLVHMLGIEPTRLKLGWFSAHEPKFFKKAIDEFVQLIRDMGPSPVKERSEIAGR